MLKPRQTLGKYRITSRLGEGGFATVYRAHDTIEGISVALKVPHPRFVTPETLHSFRREVRLTANLDHPNILPLKNASFIGKHFVIVFPLGEGTLSDRLRRRISHKSALHFTEQMLEALAFAHRHRIIHCDIKPANFILFPDYRIRLTDFGIAKVALGTQAMSAKGTGTIGYIAPEQAMGKPSLRSDVFSMGLVIYRIFAGALPEWPYEWPLPGAGRLRKSMHPDFISFLRRALEVDEQSRFKDGQHMLDAFRRVRGRAARHVARKRRRRRQTTALAWQDIRLKDFRKRYGGALAAKFTCGRCGGPVSEPMRACPWCSNTRRVHRDTTSFPRRCRRCKRGMKADWRFCPWCYGPSMEPDSAREYSDVRYTARCQNPSCKRKRLMPFMQYCPWCRTKVTRSWKITGSREKCPRCGWGVLGDFWSHCPWCARSLGQP